MRSGKRISGDIREIKKLAKENPYVIFKSLDEPHRCRHQEGVYFCPDRGWRYVNTHVDEILASYGRGASCWVVVEDFTLGDSTYKLHKYSKGIYKRINLP